MLDTVFIQFLLGGGDTEVAVEVELERGASSNAGILRGLANVKCETF